MRLFRVMYIFLKYILILVVALVVSPFRRGKYDASKYQGYASPKLGFLASVQLIPDFCRSAFAMMHTSGRQSETSLRLVLANPSQNVTPARSWIGGTPHLPSNVKWPEVETKQAVFLAQICCEDLPSKMWAGNAPATGWLCFFASPEHLSKVLVLHVKGSVKERRAPSGAVSCQSLNKTRERLLELAGEQFRLTPRWGVVPRLAGRQKEPDIRDTYRGRASAVARCDSIRHKEFNLGDFPPVNKATGVALVECFQSYLDRSTTGSLREDLQRLDPKGVVLASREQTKNSFEKVSVDFLLHLGNEEFDPERASQFVDELQHINTENWHLADTQKMPAALAFHEQPVMRYFEFLETDLRFRYRDRIENLSGRYREFFSKYWAILAEAETPLMGGKSGLVDPFEGRGSPERLLELPSSNLLGWTFGDSSSLSFYISPKDLKRRNWRAAWGDVAN